MTASVSPGRRQLLTAGLSAAILPVSMRAGAARAATTTTSDSSSALAAAATSAVSAAPGPPGARTSFALIGDLPYWRFELANVPALLGEMAEQCAFGIHVGDLKGGSEPCSDELLESRLALFGQSRIPLVYTPGDNEWTDCWRPAAGDHDPAERLAWLRRRVFLREAPWLGPPERAIWRQLATPAAEPLLAKGPVRQSDVEGGPPENLMWTAGGVLFLTLNLPGSDNGRRSPLDDADRLERDAHNRRWLEQARQRAERAGLPAIAVAIHANPGFGRGIDPSRVLGDDGYASFRHDLAQLNARFSGHVLVMHGDTHRFRVDRILPRLTRVECFGSPFTGSWVRIEVTPQRPMPFEITVRPAAPPRDESTP